MLSGLTAAQTFVSYALSIGAIELIPEGRRLKSGRVSPYFFNSAFFNTGDSVWKLAVAYANTIHHLDHNLVYGPPYKGTILAPMVAAALCENYDVKVGWSTSRKEAKPHGEGGIWLGETIRHKDIIIVDDVITTGGTKAEALDLVREEGGRVVGVVIAFDRMEQVGESGQSAAELFYNQHGIPVHAVANLDDLIVVLENNADFTNNPPGLLERIKEYRAKFGVNT